MIYRYYTRFRLTIVGHVPEAQDRQASSIWFWMIAPVANRDLP